MTQAILSVFVLGSTPTSVVFGFNYTLFDPVFGGYGTPRFIFPSVEQQLRTGRNMSDYGLLDLTTAPDHWIQLTDTNHIVTPRDAALQLATALIACDRVWVPELKDTHHVLDSFANQYAPEYRGHIYGPVVQCAQFATRDCLHSEIISALHTPHALQA